MPPGDTQNYGPARQPPWMRTEIQLLAGFLALAGGGFGSHTALSSGIGAKLETQGEKLDSLKTDFKTDIVELKGHVLATERSVNELSLNHSALVARVTALETREAGHTEQLAEIQRRIHDIENKAK
jgi:chromosome segregation ATPase